MRLSPYTQYIACAMMLVLIMGTGAAAEQTVAVAVAEPAILPMPVATPPAAGDFSSGNFSKLDANPTYYSFNLKPGERKETTVTIRNRDTKAVALHPVLKPVPYATPYMLDNSWISISPASAEVPAGGSVKFTITGTAPADAQRGSYSSMIVFTDEQFPSQYPTPYPNYIHQMNIGVNVVSPPAVRISPAMISDQIEAGKEYRYAVEITNTGTAPIQLNPKADSENYPIYGPGGSMEPALTGSAFTLNAPGTLQPGTTGTLNIVLNTPASASGYYNGYIDLGIDDPSLMREEGRIMMNFNIWKQPPEAYVKKFTMDAEEPVTIDLSSGMSWYTSMPADVLRDMPLREPSFETTLTGPDGAVALSPAKKVIKGNVNLGSDMMPAGMQKAGTYQETNTQYIVTYTAKGKPGAWQLSVMPKNSMNFEYTITLGGEDRPQASITSQTVVPPVTNETASPAPAAVSTTPQ